MSSTVIVGVNWGDEGKGRIVDYLAGDADFVVRYQGGSNAGHTVVTDRGVFKLNLVPSGVLSPQVINVLGPGMVIDIEHLNRELAGLESRGVGPINHEDLGSRDDLLSVSRRRGRLGRGAPRGQHGQAVRLDAAGDRARVRRSRVEKGDPDRRAACTPSTCRRASRPWSSGRR